MHALMIGIFTAVKSIIPLHVKLISVYNRVAVAGRETFLINKMYVNRHARFYYVSQD